jgi:hypothetical protein
MGNKQSTTAPPSTKQEKVTGPPPLDLSCDLECEKKKKLVLLKDAFDKASEKKEEDPAAYDKARIAYYTLLHGQGWLNTEKQRIARENVQPNVTDFNNIYNSLKQEKQSQSIFANLADQLNQDDSPVLDKQLTEDKDKSRVLDRLNELNSGSPTYYSTNNWISYLIDGIIVVLGIVIAYLIYTKYPKWFGSSTESTTY